MSRSSWKISSKNNIKIELEKKPLIILTRQNRITSDYLGCLTKIYNGIRFYDVIITEKMLGHKFGEFAPTRKYPKHKKKK